MERPEIHLVADTLAIRFEDGLEAYFLGPFLRDKSPSAERQGEADLFGQVHGGESGKDYSATKIINWQWVGGYAIRIFYSDGHSSGLYTYQYLRVLAEEQNAAT